MENSPRQKAEMRLGSAKVVPVPRHFHDRRQSIGFTAQLRDALAADAGPREAFASDAIAFA
jgi:hypothetical protein